MLQYCAMLMMLVLVAQNKDVFQRLLYRFNCTANQVSEYGVLCLKNEMPDNFKNTYKMQAWNRKQKKLNLNTYTGIELSGYGYTNTEVKQQTTKALREAGCLNDTVWKNTHIDIIKSRIYKIVIMTYTARSPTGSNTTKIL